MNPAERQARAVRERKTQGLRRHPQSRCLTRLSFVEGKHRKASDLVDHALCMRHRHIDGFAALSHVGQRLGPIHAADKGTSRNHRDDAVCARFLKNDGQ
jgi:hypothetical protein